MLKFLNHNRRKKLKKFLIILMFLYFIIISIKLSIIIYDNFKKNETLKTLITKLNDEISLNNKLQSQIQLGLTDEFVSEKARNELNMTVPFERVFFNTSFN